MDDRNWPICSAIDSKLREASIENIREAARERCKASVNKRHDKPLAKRKGLYRADIGRRRRRESLLLAEASSAIRRFYSCPEKQDFCRSRQGNGNGPSLFLRGREPCIVIQFSQRRSAYFWRRRWKFRGAFDRIIAKPPHGFSRIPTWQLFQTDHHERNTERRCFSNRFQRLKKMERARY